jgi:hypothetical protein
LATPPAIAPASSFSPRGASPSISAPPENGEPVVNDPVISGPSFLGLNKPSDGRYGEPMRARANFGRRDSHSSDQLDYLLDDDEEPTRGWGKLLVVVIALALIGGFGYLRWKQGGFNFLKPAPASSQNVPGAAATGPTNPDSGSTNAPEKPSSENQSAGNPAPPNSAPAPASATPANQDSTNPSPTPDAAAGGTAPAPVTNGASGAQPSTDQAVPANSTPAQNTPADTTSQAKPDDNASGDNSTESNSGEDAEAEPSKPEPHAKPEAAKPSAARALRERKPTPVTPLDATVEAERYIYGRGVAQDCDRGLRLLKPAAAQANPKAMITLGSLYSSGTCTPRDLPTAYRWFALALHKQPDNQALQDNLQKLWSQMTQPERQLAIKLSQ